MMNELIREWHDIVGEPSIKALNDDILNGFEELLAALRYGDPEHIFQEVAEINYQLIQMDAIEYKKSNASKYRLSLDSLINAQNMPRLDALCSMGATSEAIKIVHESNMSKLCKTLDDAIETGAAYRVSGVETSTTKKVDGYIVRRLINSQVLNSKSGYKSPENALNELLKGY